MWDIPQWVTAMLVALPFIIFVVVAYKLVGIANDVLANIERKLEDADKIALVLKLMPYMLMFYYIGRFMKYVLSAGAWGWTGEQFTATPVRESMKAMMELMLMEGVPVVLGILFATTAIRSAYVYMTEGRG